MKLYKKLLKRIENGEPIYCNETFAKDLEAIADKHYKKQCDIPIVIDTEGELFAFSKFLLDCSYVRGKYYPETLVKLFKGK